MRGLFGGGVRKYFSKIWGGYENNYISFEGVRKYFLTFWGGTKMVSVLKIDISKILFLYFYHLVYLICKEI